MIKKINRKPFKKPNKKKPLDLGKDVVIENNNILPLLNYPHFLSLLLQRNLFLSINFLKLHLPHCPIPSEIDSALILSTSFANLKDYKNAFLSLKCINTDPSKLTFCECCDLTKNFIRGYFQIKSENIKEYIYINNKGNKCNNDSFNNEGNNSNNDSFNNEGSNCNKCNKCNNEGNNSNNSNNDTSNTSNNDTNTNNNFNITNTNNNNNNNCISNNYLKDPFCLFLIAKITKDIDILKVVIKKLPYFYEAVSLLLELSLKVEEISGPLKNYYEVQLFLQKGIIKSLGTQTLSVKDPFISKNIRAALLYSFNRVEESSSLFKEIITSSTLKIFSSPACHLNLDYLDHFALLSLSTKNINNLLFLHNFSQKFLRDENTSNFVIANNINAIYLVHSKKYKESNEILMGVIDILENKEKPCEKGAGCFDSPPVIAKTAVLMNCLSLSLLYSLVAKNYESLNARDACLNYLIKASYTTDKRVLFNISNIYYSLKQYDYSLYYSNKIVGEDVYGGEEYGEYEKLFEKENEKGISFCTLFQSTEAYCPAPSPLDFLLPPTLKLIGRIYIKFRQYPQALYFLKRGFCLKETDTLLYMAEIFKKTSNKKNAIFCYKEYIKVGTRNRERVLKYLIEYYEEIGDINSIKELR